MKALLVGLSCVSAIGLACAADLYVDKDNPSADDSNPGTESAPFKSIQAAVAFAATTDSGYVFSDGDTIWVKPGVYDNGGVEGANGLTNRVSIAKPVRLVATAGKEKTFIVGAHDPTDGTYGCGPAAVRCVYVTTVAKDSIIRGFTIEKGAVLSSSNTGSAADAYAGGILSDSGSYVVDCTIRDCRGGRYGALYNGTVVRTLLCGNQSNYAWGICARFVTFLNCIFWENGNGQSRYTVVEGGKAVNCSFVDNFANGLDDTSCYNVLQTATLASTPDSIYEKYRPRTSANHICSTNATVNVLSTVTGDFRLLPSSPAVSAGDASHLAKVTLPSELEDERTKDYFGNVIESGSIHCGAVQEVCTPQGGRISLEFKGQTPEGRQMALPYGYIYSEAYPTQHVVKAVLAAGEHLFGLRNEPRLGNVDGLYPDRSDRFFLTPSPNALTNDTYQLLKPEYVCWVDGTDGDDNLNDGTEKTPFKTLKKATDAVTAAINNGKRGLIYVRKGTYEEGSAGGCCLTLPASRYCFVRAVDGPEETFIRGGAGIGCVSMPYFGAVQGFTLTGADTSGNDVCGVLRGIQGTLDWLLDCVITNNVSGSASLMNGGSLQRCLVAGNHATAKFLLQDIRLVSSVLTGNTVPDNQYVVNGGQCMQSTVAGNAGPLMYGTACYNCILSGTGTLGACTGAGNTLWGGATCSAAGYTVQDPKLVDPASGDCRVTPDSPTIGGGEKPTADNYAAVDLKGWRMLSTSTYEGKHLRFTEEGIPDAGAIQYDHPSVVRIEEDESGALVVTGGAKIGSTPVAQGRSVTFTVSRGTSAFHCCMGFNLNGAFVSFDDYPAGWTTNYTANGDSLLLSAVFSNVFYAAPNGDDANDGWTRETPKTLQGAVDHAKQYGDTVVALAGTYDKVATREPATAATLARVAIPGNVTLVSDEGAEKTFIIGEPSTDGTATEGCGPDAVRCVRFTESGGRICGFTLTGGYSGLSGAGAAETGPAVLCKDNAAYIENCVISNNTVAWRGGCYNGTYVNCQFLANKSLSGGEAPALYYGVALGCYINHNRGGYTMEYSSALVNCTFGKDNLQTNGRAGPNIWGSGTGYKTYNCLFLNGAGGSNSGEMKNCVFASDAAGNVPDPATYTFGCENVILKPFAQLGVDEEGRPLAKDAVTVDRGAKALYDAYGMLAMGKAADVVGGQRVYNAAIDIGAFEFDWRTDFGAILGRKVTVSEMSPEVTTNAAGLVYIPAGTFAFTRAERTGRERGYALGVDVTGSGVLTVVANGGAPQTFGAGSHKVELKAASATFNIAYAPGTDDAGGVVLTSFSREADGMTILVR